MKNKRAISLCMLLFSLFNFTACEKTENAEVKVDLFDNEKALNISKDYLLILKMEILTVQINYVLMSY